jgi:hypothetical protein
MLETPTSAKARTNLTICALAAVLSLSMRMWAQQFCGVAVPAGVVVLLQQLKTHYGRPVDCVLDPSLRDKGIPVILNGEPSIHINPTIGGNPLTIAHELLHIELDSKGYAANPMGRLPPPPNGISRDRQLRFGTLLYDEIQHRIIFPRLKQVGILHGDSEFPKQQEQDIENNVIDTFPELEAIYMLRLYHEGNLTLLKRDKEYLRHKGLAPIVELGDWLISQDNLRKCQTTQVGLAFMWDGTVKAYSRPDYYTRPGPFV